MSFFYYFIFTFFVQRSFCLLYLYIIETIESTIPHLKLRPEIFTLYTERHKNSYQQVQYIADAVSSSLSASLMFSFIIHLIYYRKNWSYCNVQTPDMNEGKNQILPNLANGNQFISDLQKTCKTQHNSSIKDFQYFDA